MHLTFARPVGTPGRTSVDVHGDTLVTRFADGQTARSVPSAAAWRAFRAVLDSSDVPLWNERYMGNLDGTETGTLWTVRIEAPSLDVRAASRDEYPGAEGTSQDAPTPEFDRYVSAVERLVGRPVR